MASSLSEALKTPFVDLYSRKLRTVEVAVLDSGIDATHPELRGKIETSFHLAVAAGKVEVTEHPPTENADTFGHGTAVASIISKVAPNARLVDFRVLGPDNAGSGEALVTGLRYAVRRGSPVINMSLAAKAEFAGRLNTLCEQAYLKGLVLVAAKRNMPLVDNGFPAEFSSCVSVDNNALGSLLEVQYQDHSPIEFVGHGTDITVAAAGGGHTTKTGTSFATPAVAGICALVLGAFPDLKPFEVKSLLRMASTI